MTMTQAAIRTQPHPRMGEVIQRDSALLIERWAQRAKAEQPTARRVHHDVLLDHMPVFLWDLGRALAEAGDPTGTRTARTAETHGDQRWETGWALAEVVRDYQILRVVILEYLTEVFEEVPSLAEVLALGVAVDDAIEASVTTFVACQIEASSDRPVEAASQEYLKVLGVLGHELRNPLAPLGNGLQILRVAASNPEQVEKTRLLMERQFRVMARLVDDLMDLPRIARGKLSLKRQRLDLTALVRGCAEDRRAAFEQADITLQVELPPGPTWTTGDATRLSQAVGNLLGNALKFTDRNNTVQVELTLNPVRRVAQVQVRDSGIGIDPEFLPRVFESYIQADRSVDRSRGGLGLGLALVKGIAELHGGEIQAASAGPGHGSTFTLTLPLLDPTAETAPPTQAPGLATTPTGRRIVIIEDNLDSAESLRLYLTLAGHEATVAHSGPAGVETARRIQPDVIVCDLGLPGLDGFQVCRTLRQDPACCRALMVALSGHGTDESRQQCLQAGFDAFLLKPADLNEVLRLATNAPLQSPGVKGAVHAVELPNPPA